MELGSHVSPWRQTGKQTRRLASARRAPQQQYKQCGGVFFLHAGLNPAQTPNRPVGVRTEPPALPCRDDVVVECGAAASESCLPSLEGRPSTTAGGLVPTGEASKATETNPSESPLWFCSTEETDLEAKASMDFNFIRLIRQQQRLPGEEPVCYSLLPEGR